jgi:hypothetical protein
VKIRLFVAFLFISNCYLVNAQMPDWVALSETFIAAFDEDNPETSKQIYLYQRCAANRLAIGWVLKEADQELAETYDKNASILAQVAAITRIMLAQERGIESPNVEEISKLTQEVVISLLEQYQAWLNNNYLLGSYFEGDETSQLEMKICDSAGSLAATLLKL